MDYFLAFAGGVLAYVAGWVARDDSSRWAPFFILWAGFFLLTRVVR